MPDIFLYTVPAFANPDDIRLTDPASAAVVATQGGYPVGGAFRWPAKKQAHKRRLTLEDAIAEISALVGAARIAAARRYAKELVDQGGPPIALIESAMLEAHTHGNEARRRAAALLLREIQREAFEDEDLMMMEG